MIKSLDELRKLAVKHILRRGPADYLLRHSLCKPWVASTQENEMAWTDSKSLFFNFPKLRSQLDIATTAGIIICDPVDPGDHTTAFLAAACHEILHILWLHMYRGKDKKPAAWRAACEYSINYDLAEIFGKKWIEHLGVMYPSPNLLTSLREENLQPTTDGFYALLSDRPDLINNGAKQISCQFCDRALKVNKHIDPVEHKIKLLNAIPLFHPERKEVLNFLIAEQTAPQKIPWEILLMGGIEDAITQEQSWSLPSRRNELMPGWRHEKLLSFVWILDVSPSIDDEMKQSFMNTLQAGINLYHDAQHRVIFFADGIEEDILVTSGTNLSRMEIPNGCGTCLNEVWEVLERDMPEYALVLTDLELAKVPKPSFTKVVWGIVGDYRSFDPNYGVKIELK